MGLLRLDGGRRRLAVFVTAAGVDDATAAAELFGRPAGQPVSKVRRMFADATYHNYAVYERVEANADWGLEIVRRPAGAKGWVRRPIRWTVDRTFAWLGKCRRPSKDRERATTSSEAFVKLAMTHLMLNRLAPKDADAQFQCRKAGGNDLWDRLLRCPVTTRRGRGSLSTFWHGIQSPEAPKKNSSAGSPPRSTAKKYAS